MIFQSVHIKLIHQGIKTETRRVWKAPHCSVGRYYPIMRDYCHKHNSEDGYILIKGFFQQKLGDMTETDAYAEGGYTLAQYRQIWININGSWNPNKVVYVIKFRYALVIRSVKHEVFGRFLNKKNADAWAKMLDAKVIKHKGRKQTFGRFVFEGGVHYLVVEK